MDPRVERVAILMEQRLHTPVTLAALSAEVGLSVSRLTRLFRHYIGSTPAAYLHALRMARARMLLERSPLTVREVMHQVGMADPSHFARDFRRVHGFSPRTFRLVLRGRRDARFRLASDPS